jgi:hypothetical protein
LVSHFLLPLPVSLSQDTAFLITLKKERKIETVTRVKCYYTGTWVRHISYSLSYSVINLVFPSPTSISLKRLCCLSYSWITVTSLLQEMLTHRAYPNALKHTVLPLFGYPPTGGTPISFQGEWMESSKRKRSL